MARNKKWNKQWNEYVDGLAGLRWVPLEEDSNRVKEIMEELYKIIDRNTE